MSITARTRKILWGRAANRCSFPGCPRELVIEVEETGSSVVVSNEAHIVAREDNGPRGNPAMPIEERDSYGNLILLCLEHHTIVDADDDYWTENRLHEMKAEHEKDVRDRMSPEDSRNLQLDVAYATIVTDWATRGALDEWSVMYDSLLAPTPHISRETKDQIDRTRTWLLNRMWPGSRPNIDASFRTLRHVMDDVAMIIDCWFREWDGDLWHRPKYKDDYVENYDELADRAEWIVDLTHDVVFEMTRAANQVILEVTLTLDPTFRRADGFLTLDRQGAGLYFEKYVPRYANDSYQPDIYPGLRDFTIERANREVYFGDTFDEVAYRDITPIKLG